MVPVRGDQESLTLAHAQPRSSGDCLRSRKNPLLGFRCWTCSPALAFCWRLQNVLSIDTRPSSRMRSSRDLGLPCLWTSTSHRLVWAICDWLVMGLNKSKLPMTATEKSPYRSTWALKRELFGLLGAANDH